MQYYFYVSSGLLLAFLIFLYQAFTQTDFKKLHILLKLIILLGVLSIVLINPKVIIYGKQLVEPYLYIIAIFPISVFYNFSFLISNCWFRLHSCNQDIITSN